jgi:hypothetical protein
MFIRLLALTFAITLPLTGATRAFASEENIQRASETNPNEKICENVTQIGSRLAKRRVCASRAEWAQRKLQDRQDIEYIQRGITTATCTAAKTNGQQIC